MLAEERVAVLEQMVSDLRGVVASLSSQVNELKQKLHALEVDVQTNTTVTNSVKKDTEEIVAIMKGLKVLGWLAKGAAAIATLVLTLKGLKVW